MDKGPLTAAEFRSLGMAWHGSVHGWQTAMARALGVDARTIRRAAKDGPSAQLQEAIERELGLTDTLPWPRGEWLVGFDESGRRYVAHLQAPRCFARVVECGEDGRPLSEEEPADVTAGVVYVADDDGLGQQVICEIDWIDHPTSGELTQLMEAAADALESADTLERF